MSAKFNTFRISKYSKVLQCITVSLIYYRPKIKEIKIYKKKLYYIVKNIILNN